ncbi:hypothetical protein K449DRAFT_469571 [Hypoxylon sp. EC38]|nr:hypothetical protein K449DRAFT_469571 [Hypoxylon sp. EC38]
MGKKKDKKKIPPLQLKSQDTEAPVPPGPLTGSSVYSCKDMDDDDPHRRFRAADIRRQAAEAPEKTNTRGAGHGRGSYPFKFWNKEEIPDLDDPPLNEFPASKVEGRNYDPKVDGDPGAARIIYNPDPSKRDNTAVVYHPDARSGGHKAAAYHPKKEEDSAANTMDTKDPVPEGTSAKGKEPTAPKQYK